MATPNAKTVTVFNGYSVFYVGDEDAVMPTGLLDTEGKIIPLTEANGWHAMGVIHTDGVSEAYEISTVETRGMQNHAAVVRSTINEASINISAAFLNRTKKVLETFHGTSIDANGMQILQAGSAFNGPIAFDGFDGDTGTVERTVSPQAYVSSKDDLSKSSSDATSYGLTFTLADSDLEPLTGEIGTGNAVRWYSHLVEEVTP